VIIDNINDNIEFISVHNKNVVINSLPSNLKVLHISDTDLELLPDLPNTLEDLTVYNNNITELSYFPPNLKFCSIPNNNLLEIPEMPKSLLFGLFFDNNIKYLSYENIQHIIHAYKKTGKLNDFQFSNNPILIGFDNILEMLEVI
jgi:hypothetical protein